MEDKVWYKSKTYGYAIAKLIAGVALWYADYLVAGGAITITAVLTALARTVTKQGVKWK